MLVRQMDERTQLVVPTDLRKRLFDVAHVGPLAAKFRRATPLNSQVIRAHLLQFKPIFDPPLKKTVRGPQSPMGGALVRHSHFLARVIIWKCNTPLGRNIIFRSIRLRVRQL